MWWLEVILAGVLVLPHLLTGVSRKIERWMSQESWTSLAGGASVAYAFIVLLPEMASGQRHLESTEWAWLTYLEHHVYLLALAGLAVFYGLERVARKSRANCARQGKDDCTSQLGFWVHIGSFAVYGAIIGWLVHTTAQEGLRQAVVMTAALSLHFAVVDRSLQDHHKKAYDRYGRWILVAAVPLGLAAAHLTSLAHGVVILMWAFVAGGIILNVLKEELPSEEHTRYAWFLGGTLAFSLLLLMARVA